MAGLSTYFSSAILNWIRSTSMPSDPAAVYIGLHSANPTDTGATGEVTTTIRPAGRVAVTFAAPSSKAIASDADVDFGNADAGATVTHFSLWDASSSGNCLGTAALTTPRTIVAGDPVLFPAGDIIFDIN